MNRRHQPSGIEPADAFLASDLTRNLEAPEFLARDRFDLGARFHHFDLRAHAEIKSVQSGGASRKKLPATRRNVRAFRAWRTWRPPPLPTRRLLTTTPDPADLVRALA